MWKSCVRIVICGVLALTLAACGSKRAELSDRTHDGRLAPVLKNLGDLHVAVTTKSQEAQNFFDQGLTLVYAFNHAEALRSFHECARLDPDCAMADWGAALALAPNINDPAIGPDREKQGYEAVARALGKKSRVSGKESVLINALAKRFSQADQPDRDRLNKDYAEAMKAAYRIYPDDPDVATLYADAVMNTMPWNYWSRDSVPRPGISEARAALENAIRKYPRHPGANHIYIHLMEASDEVDLAVPAADRLGSLVPAAGHLVHMPAHVYIRVGRYADASAANVKAIAADEDYITECRAQGIYPAAYYPHNIHFLNATLMMEGRSSEALAAANKVASQHDSKMMQEPGFGFAHLLKTIPYLTMVRFGRWEEILQQPQPPADRIFGRAMLHFARGFAFSASGKLKDAESELESLRKLEEDASLRELKIFDVNSLSSLAEIASAMLEGEVARKSENFPASVAAFRRAVQKEDSLLYSEPPDWPLPPRQFLGATLVEAGRIKQAESVYRQDLKRHRANGWSLCGLAICLEKEGKTSEAARARQQFAKAWSRADAPITDSRF